MGKSTRACELFSHLYFNISQANLKQYYYKDGIFPAFSVLTNIDL